MRKLWFNGFCHCSFLLHSTRGIFQAKMCEHLLRKIDIFFTLQRIRNASECSHISAYLNFDSIWTAVYNTCHRHGHSYFLCKYLYYFKSMRGNSSWIIIIGQWSFFSSSLQIRPQYDATPNQEKPLGSTTRNRNIGFHFHEIISLKMKQLIFVLLEHEHEHKYLFTRPLIHITQTLTDSNSWMQ